MLLYQLLQIESRIRQRRIDSDLFVNGIPRISANENARLSFIYGSLKICIRNSEVFPGMLNSAFSATSKKKN